MTPNLLDELEKIVALSEKATPGEWYSDERRYGAVIWSQTSPAAIVRAEDEEGRYGTIDAADAELVVSSVNFLHTHHAEIADMAKRMEALQSLAAAMYQAAGAYDMPARFLDVLSAAGNGKPITEEQVDALLPCETPDTLQRLEAAERECEEQARLNGMGAERELALRAKLEAAERDAARYQWLRGLDSQFMLKKYGCGDLPVDEDLDAEIDAAIDATQEGGG